MSPRWSTSEIVTSQRLRDSHSPSPRWRAQSAGRRSPLETERSGRAASFPIARTGNHPPECHHARRSAWARTPEPPGTRSCSPTSGTSRCNARTNAGLEKDRCTSSRPLRQCFAAMRQNPGNASDEARSFRLEVGAPVAFALKGEDGAGAGIHAAADTGGEMNLEKGNCGSGTG